MRSQSPVVAAMSAGGRGLHRRSLRRRFATAGIAVAAVAAASSPAAASEEAVSLTPFHSMMWPGVMFGQKCLDIADYATDESAEVVQSWCSGGTNQTFRMSGTGPFGIGPYLVQAHHSGRCIEAASYKPLVQTTCKIDYATKKYDSHQGWLATPVMPFGQYSWVYELRNVATQDCLTVQGGSYLWRARIAAEPCTGAHHQLWVVYNRKLGVWGKL